MEYYDSSWLADLWRPSKTTGKFDSGQVTIIGGGKLFHGAPILALKAVSRIVGMVYFSTPSEQKEIADLIKANLASFIWVPRGEVGMYIEKSQAVLIGPGLMRSHPGNDGGLTCDEYGRDTHEITMELFSRFPDSKWVIDGGSLQVIRAEDLPRGSVITPNNKEYEMLFREELSGSLEEKGAQIMRKAQAYRITILYKGSEAIVSDGERVVVVNGGGEGGVKGGGGDVIAGVAVGLLAKNDAILASSSAVYLVKMATVRLNQRQAEMFNSDDLADEVAKVYGESIDIYRK